MLPVTVLFASIIQLGQGRTVIRIEIKTNLCKWMCIREKLVIQLLLYEVDVENS